MRIYKQNCDPGAAEDKTLPVNSYIVTYVDGEETLYDIVIGNRVDIFDYYWDRYREGLKSFVWTSGTVPAKVWSSRQEYQKKSEKKKR